MIILITGASSGIGRALALHYLDQGHTVAAVARRAPLLASLRAGRPEIGDRYIAFPADVTDRIRMAAIVESIERTLGPIELAIASAGVAEEQTTPDLDLEALERALTTNVAGALNALVPAAAAMRQRGHGHVVAISSLAGEQSLPRMTSYCVSKAALNSAMAGLDLLLRGSGICVTTVCPGFIATDMTNGRVPSRQCMSLDRAVTKIMCALRQRKRMCRFPFWQSLPLRLLRLVPTSSRQPFLMVLWDLMFGQKESSTALGATRSIMTWAQAQAYVTEGVIGSLSMTRHRSRESEPHDFWTNLRYQLTLNSFIRPTNILPMVSRLPEISLRYLPRALLIAFTSLAAQPPRVAQWICYGRRIARTQIDKSPIFIIGHWRSGTTHLHNLFSQDPALGWVTMYQALAPDCSLIGGKWLKRLLGRTLPARRPMDNMVWPIDSPQEEEVALGKTSAYSLYAQFLFPRHARAFFARHVLLQDVAPHVAREVKTRYQTILKVATIHADGRRLVLKNPVNTARIRMLLELFPDAKFVHIHRCPYEVFASTRNLNRSITAFTTLQTLDTQHADDTVFELYEGMMRRFFADRASIPAGNFVEVAFAALERDPLQEMQQLYKALSLPGFAQAEPAVRRYLADQKSYRKNVFVLHDSERVRIAERWGFAFAELGYATGVSMPDELPAEHVGADSRTCGALPAGS